MSRTEKVKIGDIFSKLTVVAFVGVNRHRKREWLCKCECGNMVNVTTGHLLSGHSTSCGCTRLQNSIKATQISNTKHGMKGTKEYCAWSELKQRCNNPKEPQYKNYGARGIKVCDRWLHSFENFFADMGKAPDGYSIDRIDVNGDYCPENCRWADNETQQYNRRDTVKITFDGITETLLYWSKKTGIPAKNLYSRFHTMKWNAEKTLCTPLRRYCHE